MKLVIVESPAKCTTIQRYLGNDYIVKASLGHIRDLSTYGKGGLGVDVEHGFSPSYVVNNEKRKVVNELLLLAKKADEVILATDPDREGEAIAWHLATVLKLNIATNKRLEFHEITRDSISEAMANPRTINLNLVASQETRRIVDRIIGFKLSNLLYKKIKSRSAGRVQSATLKIIADQDNEIAKFVPEEYWNILTSISLNGKEFKLTYKGPNGKQIEIKNEAEALKILNSIPDKLTVSEVKKYVKTTSPHEPFTTSTMQQEAFAKLKFKTKKTQFIAQGLYEGIEVNGEHMGLITYMRTDSTRLSPTFVNRATNFIEENFGKEYLGHQRRLKSSMLSQDAHEAIRPTSNHRTPDSIKAYLTTEQYNLYKLIYNRALASLMQDKKEEVCEVTLEGNGQVFSFSLNRTIFKGFEIVYKDNDEKDNFKDLPSINKGDVFTLINKDKEQKFTQPPSHYTEAKIVKKMEDVGIGRPSTYSSTIETLKNRKYIEDKAGVLTVTEQGNKTAHVLDKYFPDIVNADYTAKMEKQLDEVQDGSSSRIKMLTEFYNNFISLLDSVSLIMYKDDLEETGRFCPKCGSPLVYKEGKNGKFVGCSNYPKCKYVEKEQKKEAVKTGDVCPKCGSPMVERVDKKGNKFVACSAYPKCSYIPSNVTPVTDSAGVTKVCPECGSPLVKKKGKYGYFYGCSNYPKCKYMEKITRKFYKK